MNSREAALKVLYEVDVNKAYLNSALNSAIKEAELDLKDKALLSEIVYGVIKNRLRIDYIINCFSKVKTKKISAWVLNILRIGIYQILFLDRIPDSAACNECVKLAKKYSNKGGAGFVNGLLRNLSRNKADITFPAYADDKIKYYSVKYSFPEWIVKKLIKQYGEETAEGFMAESNMPHGTDIRVNTLKISTAELSEILSQKGIKHLVSEKAENLISVFANINLTATEEYKNGMFSLQNSSSKRAVDVLSPLPGDTVIDVCAAPGGKSCAAAELMNNEGEILSFDLYEHKKALIENSASRLGISIISAEVNDAEVLKTELVGKADKVIIDAPCSGIGVIHKKPDIKWTRKEEDILELKEIQRKILATASKYVKPGGTLLYSTCTVFKEENEENVEEFLKCNAAFYKDYEEQILTDKAGGSGFYICKMILKG